ncbi:MAG TPA: pantetheine-phosphate adenylyltransferase [Caulobacteraceae bacterium]|jgi:pantetheine-phosphate adenylyltransferase|nr:pantetheine-phosphate adenylyltransferase [Caulobacteraceae bacterium]
MTVRTGLYAGTFDPITKGHIDIVARAVKLVDRLVIGVAVNRDKGPLFSLDERVLMVEQELAPLVNGAEIVVRPFENLLMHFARDVGAGVIIRGLRAATDFEYEFLMTGMNQQLDRDIETVFLMADPKLQAIASRFVKEIAHLGGDVSAFVPPRVAARLKEKFAS